MAAKKQRESAPAADTESREKQLTNLAVNLAEKQLREGTASPSVITHFLKLASNRETLERDILDKQAKLMEAKAKAIGKDKDTEELTKNAIEAMKAYQPSSAQQ